MYVHIGVITYLYGVVLVVCATICVNKQSYTTIYCGALVAFDVDIVVACGEVVVVFLNSGDLCAIRVYLVPCTTRMAFMDSLSALCVVHLPYMPAFALVHMVVWILCIIWNVWFVKLCAVITRYGLIVQV